MLFFKAEIAVNLLGFSNTAVYTGKDIFFMIKYFTKRITKLKKSEFTLFSDLSLQKHVMNK